MRKNKNHLRDCNHLSLYFGPVYRTPDYSHPQQSIKRRVTKLSVTLCYYGRYKPVKLGFQQQQALTIVKLRALIRGDGQSSKNYLL